MSPQYTLKSAFPPRPHSSIARAQKMLEQEDPRFRIMDRMLARAYLELQRRRNQQRRAGIFTPRMDLCDDPNNPFITAIFELPGMKADQLSVRIENGHLIVEGERAGPRLDSASTLAATSGSDSTSEPTRPQPSSLYPIQELKYGKFRRELKLPDGVSAAHVRSMLAEGMLTVSWPRDPLAVPGYHGANGHTTQSAARQHAQADAERGGGELGTA